MADERSNFDLIEKGNFKYVFILVADDYCFNATEHRELFETLRDTFAPNLSRFGKLVMSSRGFEHHNYERILNVNWRNAADAQSLRHQQYPKLLVIEKDFADFQPYQNDRYAIIDFAEFRGITLAVLDFLRQVEAEVMNANFFEWWEQREAITDEELGTYAEELGYPRDWRQKETVSQGEAAKILRRSERTIRKYLSEGVLDRTASSGVYVPSLIRYLEGED